MTEWNSLNDQQLFRLKKINEIKDYFVAEIKEKELMSRILSKYIACFDYFDKSLIVLSVTGSISIATVIGVPVGIVSANFSLAFSIFKWIVKNLLKTTRNKKKKQNKVVMFARSKWNSIKKYKSKSFKN